MLFFLLPLQKPLLSPRARAAIILTPGLARLMPVVHRASRLYILAMTRKDSSNAGAAPAKDFIPLLCPQCGGLIGELSTGQVRLLCLKCKVKTVFSRLETDKAPYPIVYLVIAPGEGYTAGGS